MTQVEDGRTVAQVILAANKLEQARIGSFANGRDVGKQLLTTMQKADAGISAPVQFLLASYIIEATHGAITGPIPANTCNQLCDINQSPTYDLSKILQVCIRWASTKDLEQQCSKRIVMKIVEVIKLWNEHFPTEPEVTTLVSWPDPVNSLEFVRDSELILPEDRSISIDINLTGRRLRHATSTVNALEIIAGITNQQITFSKSSSNPGKKPAIWCGVVLEDDEIQYIPQKPKEYVEENRYGSVIFEFPIESTSRVIGKEGFLLGTRKFMYEYSQAILIPESSSPLPPNMPFVVLNETGDQITPLNMVDLTTFNWELSYGPNGEWTHPELAFENELKLPVSEIKVSFADHNCPTQKSLNCDDCQRNFKTKEGARNHFQNLLISQNLTGRMKSTLGSALTSEDYVGLFGSDQMEQD